MLTKSLTIEKMDNAGTGLARIATLSAVDSDGDTYMPGAFSWKEGGYQWAQMLPAHDRRAMPFGKVRVYEEGDGAYAELNLNLDTQAGRDWHAALKFDLAKGQPVQEWSYGFGILDAGFEQRNGERVRVLKRLDVHEVSPVLKGAGVGTTTIAIKGAAFKGERFTQLLTDLGELADALDANPSILSTTGVKQLADIHASMTRALSPWTAPPDDGHGLVDQAVGDYLRGLSRRHLRTD
jgi:HK97 family phage prohead protease